MTTSTTIIDMMGLQAAYANLHTDQERDYFMQREHDGVSSFFFFSSRRRHTRFDCDWSSDVCSSDLLLHGRILRSPIPHGNIRSIDASKALALPGVEAVVTCADLNDPGDRIAELEIGRASCRERV